MGFAYYDRVKETSTTTGTGSITLAGAATGGFQTFASVFSTNDYINYCITDQSGNSWETGIGQLTGATTLTRVSVLYSSNSNALVNFTSGSLYVFNTISGIEPSSMTTFGHGQDGNVTIGAGGVTLTRDMYYKNLTLNGSSGVLQTAGNRVYVSEVLDISAALSKAITPLIVTSLNGGNATGTNSSTAGTAGGAAASNTIGGGAAGGGAINGGRTGNQTNPGITGSQAGAGVTPANGGTTSSAGGNGGNGNNGANLSTGGGGSSQTINNPFPIYKVRDDLDKTGTLVWGGSGGGGGCGGAGDGTNFAGGGGGGGGGGSVLAIFARFINRGSNTNASIIFVGGGNGGNGGTPTVGACGGGGGGGAGSGGWLYLVYEYLMGSAITNCLDASGGNGGNGGTHAGGASNTNGNGASGAYGGRVTVFNLGNSTSSELDNTTTAGAAFSGVTGGAGTSTKVTL